MVAAVMLAAIWTRLVCFSLELSIPLWVPTGIGIVGIGLFGWRVIPGYLLGLILDVLFLSRMGGEPVMDSLPLLISNLGRLVTVIVGGLCLYRLFQSNTKGWGPYGILRHLLIAPLCGLFVGSVVELSVISFSGVKLSDYFNWWMCQRWVEDYTGLLVILPLVIVGKPYQHQPKRFIWGSLFSLGLCVAAILILVGVLEHEMRRRIAHEFQYVSKNLGDVIEESFGHATLIVELLASSPLKEKLKQPEFEEIAKTAHIACNAHAVTYIEVFDASLLSHFEAEIEVNYSNKPYRIHQLAGADKVWAGERSNWVAAIEYVYPYEQNKAAVGLDVLNHPMAGESVWNAFKSDQTYASPLLSLVQRPDSTDGIVIYRRGSKRISPSGYDVTPLFSIVFSVEEILATFLDGRGREFSKVVLSEFQSKNEVSYVLNEQVELHLLNNSQLADFTVDYIFSFGGRNWLLKCVPSEQFFWVNGASIIRISHGLMMLLLLLLGVILLSTRFRQIEIEKEVSRRTKALKKATKRAERSERVKSDFLAVMSHEIRTPMNGIIGGSDLLAKSELTGEQSELVKMIRVSGELLSGLVNDILDISKLDAGKYSMQYEPFDLKETFLATVDHLKTTAVAKGLTVNSEITGTDDWVVIGDSGRISQVLLNLGHNAVKFTDEGMVALEMEGSVGSDDCLEVSIAVKDTGIGIPKNQIKHVFDQFFQVDSSSRRRYEGSGLGLTITKRLVELIGGTLTLESEEGVGTTFQLKLQLKRHVISPAEEVKELKKRESMAERSKVLVVEDNKMNQRLVEMLLKKLGWSSDLVDDGLIALEQLKSQSYAFVLLDCRLPGLDGYEVARKIREREAAASENKTPMIIIALTANRMEGDREKCLKAGMDDYLSKPINLKQLQTKLDEWF